MKKEEVKDLKPHSVAENPETSMSKIP